MPRVLIITPTFNSSAFIAEALQSVQRQNFKDWILVVVDDGSKDNTLEIVARFAACDPRIRSFPLGKNFGYPSIPRNRGLEFAQQEKIDFDYVAYLDSDDCWPPNKLEIQLRAAEANPTAGLFYFRRLQHLRETQIRQPVRRRKIDNLTQLLFFSHVSISTVLLRKEIALRFHPLFDEDPSLKAMEDYEAWIGLMAHGVEFHAIDAEGLIYRIHADNISTNDFSFKFRRYLHLYAKVLLKYRTIPFLLVLVALWLKSIKFAIDSVKAFLFLDHSRGRRMFLAPTYSRTQE